MYHRVGKCEAHPAYLVKSLFNINLGVQPDPTALLRFLSGISLEANLSLHSPTPALPVNTQVGQCKADVASELFFQPSDKAQLLFQCKTTVWLPYQYVHCSIVMHVTKIQL